jgi:TPR repeat protein
VPTNINRASLYWKDAARQHEPEAEYRLGEAYQRAIGFSNRNPELAEELFRRAAESGQPEASTVVGRLLLKDQSTVNDAIALTATGAKRSHPPAMYVSHTTMYIHVTCNERSKLLFLFYSLSYY